MKKLLLILLCLPLIGFGQSWEKTFGIILNNYGSSVQQTTDGGYIIVGSTCTDSNSVSHFYDVYLIKTDGSGIEQWHKTFGGFSAEGGDDVKQTADGGYIITGSTASFGNGGYDVYLIKTNSNGDSLWTKTFGGTGHDYGNSVQQTTDGGYIITGNKESSFNSSSWGDFYLIKTDSNGDSLWTKTFGPAYGSSQSGQQTTDGGYIIIGATTSFGNGNSDAYLIKTDGNGDSLWTKTFGGIGNDYGNSVQQTTDGGYIITGDTWSFGNGYADVYLIKTNSNGDSLWTKTFGGIEFDVGYSVQQTTDGGYIITGWTESFGVDGKDVYLIKTNSNGSQQWTKTFDGTWVWGDDVGRSVQQTTDGGYIITGYTEFDWSCSNVYLIKTDGSGNVTSTFNISINPNRKLQKTVDMLGRDIKPKANTPFIEIYDDGTVEKRIVIE